MRIGELFDTAVEEKIDPVIKVGETGDDRKLAAEIGSYVVTPLIERYVDDILEQYTDSFLTQSTEIGIWISGYFGSGKSHFAKILALLAGNRKLEGLTACDRFAPRIPADAPRRSSILRSLGRMPGCDTRVLAFNLNTLSDSRSRPLPQLLLSQHYQSLGYGKNFIYARVIEAELDREEGQLDKLHAAVARRAGKPWEQVQNNPAFYSKHLFDAASEVAPIVFPSPGDVKRALDDAQNGELYNAAFLVKTLLDDVKRREAETKRPQRLMLVLDESGQWIENDGGRLAQLQAFIEEAAAVGQGKIWIIVTTHGDMGAIYKEARARQEDFKKIEGRFRFKPALTTENIEQVLEDRLFRKKLAANTELKQLYATRGGVLRGIGELANTNRVLPACTEDKFATYYPFFPYQVHLIPEIVKSLRSKGGRGEQMTGSTRTLLAITQDILRAGRRRYLDEAVGALVSFDEVFYNLVGEGEISPDVRTELSRLQDVVPGSTALTPRVAEVLYLVRELSYIPRTLDNLARLLVEDTDQDLPALVARVEPEIQRLIQAKMVARVGEEYEFLTGERRTFEEEVSQCEINDIREQEREKGLTDHFVQHGGESHWRTWLGSNVLSYLGREFPFRLRVDEAAVSGTGGDVSLNLISPLAALGRTTLADLESLSLRADEQNTVYFLSGRVTGFDRSLSRYLAMKQVIDAWKSDPHKSEEARKMAADCETNDLAKARDEVRKGMVEGIRGGYMVFRGSSRALVVKSGTKPEDALRAEMATFWPTIYAKFDRMTVKVTNDQKAITDVLAGSSNPSADVRELKLYDKAGKLDPHSPLLDAIRIHLSTEQNAGRRIVGKGLLEKFSAPPFGWDSNALRVGVAAMVRAGAIKVLISKKPYTNPADPELVDAIRVSRSFDRVELVLEETDVPPEVLTETRTFLIQLAKKRGVDETPAALSEMAGSMASAILQKVRTVRTWAEGSGMPLPAAFSEGEDAWRSIEALANPVHRVREIHTRQQELQAGKEAIDACAAFQEKSAAQYTEMSALVNDLDPVSHRFDGEKGIEGFLEAWHAVAGAAGFGDPEKWKRLQACKSQATLELHGVLDRWRADARQQVEDALVNLPVDLARHGLDEALLDKLSNGLVALRERIDSLQSASQVAALPDKIVAEVRRVGNVILAKAAEKVPVSVPGPDPVPVPPKPRVVRRLRTREVSMITRVQTVEEWNALRNRLDERVRGLLAEGYEVELE